MANIREIVTRVKMGFYGNSGEDFGELYINRKGWEYDENEGKVSAPSSDWMFLKRNQLTTYGMQTEKYATLDKSTCLDGTFILANASPFGITGLASDVLCDASGNYVSEKPVITQYYTMSRDMSQIIIDGHRAMDQYPAEYDIIAYYTGKSDTPAIGSAAVSRDCHCLLYTSPSPRD